MAEIDRLYLIDENLTELLTNTVDMASVFYDIFLNPEPMDVSFQMFNNENELITVTIPNRAKDRVTPYVGEGSPEGVVAAPIGSAYINTLTSIVYYKISGSDQYGWNAVVSQDLVEMLIQNYLEQFGYLTVSGYNARLYNDITQGNIQTSSDLKSLVASDSNYGVVELDGTSIINNLENKISCSGLVDKNDNSTKGLWSGNEIDYDASSSDTNTFYVLEDAGKIVLGNMEIAGTSFPSGTPLSYSLDSGVETIAPTNGWFYVSHLASSTSEYIRLENTVTNWVSEQYGVVGAPIIVACPALKGESIEVIHNISLTNAERTTGLKFYKALGNRLS